MTADDDAPPAAMPAGMPAGAPAGLPGALLEPAPPWLYRWTGAATTLHGLVRAGERAGLVCRVLRGAWMRTEPGCFDELAEALQLPDHFGRNWDAVRDCLTDLEQLPGPGYLLLVRDADQVLAEEPAERLGVLLRVLDRSAAEWAEPVARGEWWDRPAVPFHAVLHTGPAQEPAVLARLAASGGHDLPLLDLPDDVRPPPDPS